MCPETKPLEPSAINDDTVPADLPRELQDLAMQQKEPGEVEESMI